MGVSALTTPDGKKKQKSSEHGNKNAVHHMKRREGILFPIMSS